MKLVAIAFAAVISAHSADAQEPLAPPQEAWGTSSTTVATSGAYAFVGPLTESVEGRRVCGAGGSCRAAVDVPSGVWIHTVEIEGCDASPSQEGVVRLWRCQSDIPGPGGCTIQHEARTGLADAPGCERFFSSVAYFTVYNAGYTYFLELFGTDGTVNVPFEFRAVRLRYTRQVSAAPQTATFSDVPTSHPFHRYVEALAGSRITGGCGGGLFCPDRPVTRAEMAAFLSIALGLNFPD